MEGTRLEAAQQQEEGFESRSFWGPYTATEYISLSDTPNLPGLEPRLPDLSRKMLMRTDIPKLVSLRWLCVPELTDFETDLASKGTADVQ